MENCKDIVRIVQKHPNLTYCEINYEGEKVQIYNKGTIFEYYPEKIQPLLGYKHIYLRKYILQAFPYTKELIINCEVLMLDINSDKLLSPHYICNKCSSDVKHIHICILVTDCFYCDGDISTKTLEERKEILKRIMIEIPNFVLRSKIKEIRHLKDLDEKKAKVINFDFHGLMFKDLNGIYEPRKPFCLKLIHGSLFNATALALELAFMGTRCDSMKIMDHMMTGSSMARYDSEGNWIRTISKATMNYENIFLNILQALVDIIQISSDYSKIPNWLSCIENMVFDFIANNPHINEISLRFPVFLSIENNRMLYTYVNSSTSTVSDNDENIKKNETKEQKLKNANKGKSKERKITFNSVMEKLEPKNLITRTKRHIPNYFKNFNNFLMYKCVTKAKKDEINKRKLRNAYEGKPVSEKNSMPIKRGKPNYFENLNIFLRNKCIKINKNRTSKRKLKNANEGKPKKSNVIIDSITEEAKEVESEELIIPIKQHILNCFENLNNFLRNRCVTKNRTNKRKLKNAHERKPKKGQIIIKSIAEEPEKVESEKLIVPIKRHTPNYFVNLNNILWNKCVAKIKRNKKNKRTLKNASEKKAKKCKIIINSITEKPEKVESEKLIAPVKRDIRNYFKNWNNFLKCKFVAKPKKSEINKRKLEDNASEETAKECKVIINSITEKPESEKLIMPMKRHIPNYFGNLNSFLKNKCVTKVKKTERNNKN